MKICFYEKHTPRVELSIMVDRQLYSGKSGFQRIDVFESEDFGRFFTLDGCIMTTEKDEFIYHEMITHVPMAVNPGIKNILVVGAGDGGVIRELTRYETVRNIDLVEIDKLVIEVCKKYLPVTSCSLDDERVNIYYEDGIGYIRQTEKKYDLIIVDSTDPVGPGESLFTKEFYENCYKALTQDGIMVNQHASPFYPDDIRVMQQTHGRIFKVFPVSEVYQAHIPTYPSGHWLFGFASKKLHPVNDLDAAKWNALGIKTKYYNTRLHTGAFALPNYAEELLRKAENKEI